MANGAKQKVQVGFRDLSAGAAARIEIAVPHGLPREELISVLTRLLPDLAKLRPRGCGRCISGADIHIRERFEEILTFEA